MKETPVFNIEAFYLTHIEALDTPNKPLVIKNKFWLTLKLVIMTFCCIIYGKSIE